MYLLMVLSTALLIIIFSLSQKNLDRYCMRTLKETNLRDVLTLNGVNTLDHKAKTNSKLDILLHDVHFSGNTNDILLNILETILHESIIGHIKYYIFTKSPAYRKKAKEIANKCPHPPQWEALLISNYGVPIEYLNIYCSEEKLSMSCPILVSFH